MKMKGKKNEFLVLSPVPWFSLSTEFHYSIASLHLVASLQQRTHNSVICGIKRKFNKSEIYN